MATERKTSTMILIVLTLAVFQSVSASNHSTVCASTENVTALNTIIEAMNATLQVILQDTSTQMDIKFANIFHTVCNNQMVLHLVYGIENYVASCPELVLQSNVRSLELGPLTFLALLEDFQSVDHFCECKELLTQVLAIEITKSDILYSDPGAYYPEVVNLTWICMMTSPPPSINFTNVALLTRDKKGQCPAVFKYSTINIARMEGFILNYCEDFSPENFTCAMNYTSDQDFNNCLELVDQSVTTPADDRTLKVYKYVQNASMNVWRDVQAKEWMLTCGRSISENWSRNFS
ncbi:uncharacterized protein LOC123554053 isoform X2 [Mercenaria mercenaria]|uniref:uncharacterized protein LOC123554053 isoform X2 n=1 Tax=Mercenaria mercenaria TaxID=6596 RepID=UPI001E1D7614|nr:uncharacterized protein LOC123554053 isoform X2 [Mercenaria mercenaria]